MDFISYNLGPIKIRPFVKVGVYAKKKENQAGPDTFHISTELPLKITIPFLWSLFFFFSIALRLALTLSHETSPELCFSRLKRCRVELTTFLVPLHQVSISLISPFITIISKT